VPDRAGMNGQQGVSGSSGSSNDGRSDTVGFAVQCGQYI